MGICFTCYMVNFVYARHFSCATSLPYQDFEHISQPFNSGKLDCNFASPKRLFMKYLSEKISRDFWSTKHFYKGSLLKILEFMLQYHVSPFYNHRKKYITLQL